jgi:hypothetical protein
MHAGGHEVKLQKYFRSLGKKALAKSAGAQQQEPAAPAASTNAVLDAIVDRRFHFRTIPSIAAETGMPERDVRSILERHADAVRRAPLENGNGNALFL